MARVAIRRAPPNKSALEAEIAHLRDLGLKELRARWRTVFRKEVPPHISRHLLFRILAHHLQVNAFGDVDSECRRLLEQPDVIGAADRIRARNGPSQNVTVIQGSILTREWNGRIYRISVLADGFAWNGKTYPSLSGIAFAITGTRWNGPRFFGLRDKPSHSSAGAAP